MTLHVSHDYSAAAPMAPAVATLQRALLWLMGMGGAIVFIEPSPYEIFALTSVVVFAATGLHMQLAFMPLALLLFAVNLGYTICAIPLLDQQPIVYWILTSWYMGITAIFLALVVSVNDHGVDLVAGRILGEPRCGPEGDGSRGCDDRKQAFHVRSSTGRDWALRKQQLGDGPVNT